MRLKKALRGFGVGGFRLLLHLLARGRVVSGPFAGLRYVRGSQGSVYNAKILGTYESELHPIVAGFAALRPVQCVDVGAGEGYYAAGLARLLGVPVIAYELDETAHPLLVRMVRGNGVESRVEIRGGCTPELLTRDLSGQAGASLVVCDVEAFERVLLDPLAVPGLRTTPVLVEIHDCIEAGTGELIRSRFEATHRVDRIEARQPDGSGFPENQWWLRMVPTRLRARLMTEGRPPGMYWYWMTPRRP